MLPNDEIDTIGWLLLILLILLLAYSSFLSYKGIDWTVLKRLEATKLVLPSPPATPSATITTAPSTQPN